MRNKPKTLAAIATLLLAGCAGADKSPDHFPGYASDRQGQLLRHPPSALGESQADSHCPTSLPRAERIACLAPHRWVLITVS